MIDGGDVVSAPATANDTVGGWLAALSPTPPAALVVRLQQVLAPYLDQPASTVPEVCLEAGERLLEALLASGSTSRASALDLLTVDALVTYGFEAGANVPDQLEARAVTAMRRIAALPVVLPGGSRDTSREPWPDHTPAQKAT